MSKPKSSKPIKPGKSDEAEAPPAADILGERLREMFTKLEAAPVPEEIKELADDLEKKRRGRRNPRRN